MFMELDGHLTVKAEGDAVKKDKKALAFIKDALSDALFRRYNQTNSKELWDKLKEDFETVDAQLLFFLRNKFLNCIKSRTESVRDYIDRLSKYKNELTDAGNEVKDSDYILTIMNGTHNEYGDFVSAMTGKKKVGEVVVADLIDQLIKEDDLRITMQSSTLITRINSNNGDRKVCFIHKNKNQIKNIKNKKTKRKCYNCGISGHYANECRKLKSQVNAVTQGKEYVCFCSDNQDSEKWLLDSGASLHVSNSSSNFEYLQPEKTTVRLGDNRQVSATGRGTVKLLVKANGIVNTLLLKDVVLVPELGVNLVSMAKIESLGLKILTENGKSTIFSEDLPIGCAMRTKESVFIRIRKNHKRNSLSD